MMVHGVFFVGKHREKGQGIIEYAGAMVTAMAMVAALLSGQGASWLQNTYHQVMGSAGDIVISSFAENAPQTTGMVIVTER